MARNFSDLEQRGRLAPVLKGLASATRTLGARLQGVQPQVEKEDDFERQLMLKQLEREQKLDDLEQAHNYKLIEQSNKPLSATDTEKMAILYSQYRQTKDPKIKRALKGMINSQATHPSLTGLFDFADEDEVAEPALPAQITPEVIAPQGAGDISGGLPGQLQQAEETDSLELPSQLSAPQDNTLQYQSVPTGKLNKWGEPEYKTEETPEFKAQQKFEGEIISARGSAIKKKFDKMSESEIAMSSLEPKIGYMMDVGARAYKELKDEAAKRDIKLDFESGGVEFWKAKLVKAGLNINRLTPLMEAVTRLRPEIGFEVMRQIGPFRSAQAGLVFTETLSAFEGHIPSDIAKSVSTMTKSYLGALGNEQLVADAIGGGLSREEQIQMGDQYEANLLRAYNRMYRNMGVTTKFYNMGIPIEEVAANSKFTETEEELIDYAMDQYPDRGRDEIIISLIDGGKL